MLKYALTKKRKITTYRQVMITILWITWAIVTVTIAIDVFMYGAR